LRTQLLALSLAACPVLAQDCPWVLETTPNPEGNLILFGLSARANDDVWAAGSRSVFLPGDSRTYNYIARWDGTDWFETNAPQPSTLSDFQILRDIIALGPDDAIAVGSYSPPASSSQSQSMRWDGSSWHLLDSPSYAGGSSFQAIGTMGDRVWAVGSKYSELPPPAALTFPMAARLDGDDWDVVYVPPLAATGGRSFNHIRAIDGASEDDGWAAGTAQEVNLGFGPAAMMIRWDGSQWTQYDLFPILSSTAFSSVEALTVISGDNAWAAGFDYDNARQQTIPLILHWDGSAWSNVPVPSFDNSAELRAIAARSADDIYAAGTQTEAGGSPHALILHYDGVQWSVVPENQLTDYGTWFRAMTVAGDDVWAAGQSNGLSDGITQRRRPCDGGCTADFNHDGSLNFFDVSSFLAAFNAQDPATDLTGDGLFNFFDISSYLDLFAAGCP
tara:strand:+ start:9126 stop:10463 length:1338 start_codon:yes stop_codon:yes gene_type:complete